VANTEGAKLRLSIMHNLRKRGLEDILIAIVEGLKGVPESLQPIMENGQIIRELVDNGTYRYGRTA
jgi:transposase-like protein